MFVASFSFCGAHLFTRSFISLSPDYILGMAKSSLGSQVLEAFLGIMQSPKLKKKFIKKLYTHFVEVHSAKAS